MKKTFAISAISQVVLLAIAGTAMANENSTTLDVIEVSADASSQGLPGEFAGGQVAKGSRLGILGNKTNLETPFSTTAYTNKIIQDKQAKSVADVLQNDPTVRVARGFGNFQESYVMRGFVTNSDDMLYNGLYGLLPRQYIASNLFERVEVQRGASAFLNGMAPGGGSLGGSIVLQPKRATNDPITRFNLGWSTDGRTNVATDLGRRFGDNNQFGVRLNVAHDEGGTGIDGENIRTTVAHLGMDWRGEKARISADLGYQENKLRGTRTSVTLATTLTDVPAPAKNTSNWAQPWSYSNEKDVFGTVRAEYDFLPYLTAFAAYGFRNSEEANSLANIRNVKLDGSGTQYRFDNTRRDYVNTAEAGVRGEFETGSITHNWVVSGNLFDLDKKNAYVMDWQNTFANNIYSPVSVSTPSYSANALKGGDLSAPKTTGKTRLKSVAFGDTLAFLDKTLLVTLGGRWQQVQDKGYAYGTAKQTSDAKEDRLSPSVGITYRVTPTLSVYSNYIEGLTSGGTVTTTTAKNYGEVLKPYVSRQFEMGTKYEGNGFGAGLSLFTISKARGYLDENNVYSQKGYDRHNGIELTGYGEITSDVRVLGGMTILSAKQRKTGSAATDGNFSTGVAKFQANLGIEWDVPALTGLTLETRVVHTGSSYVNVANTQKAKGWTRFDAGARYILMAGDTPITLRAKVDNVTNKKYWASTGGYSNAGAGYLVQGAPRTYSVAASVDF